MRYTLLFMAMACAASMHARRYEISAPLQPKTITEGQLRMGGDGITVNNYYISQDGRPMIPVTGEFHYSRYPAEEWEWEIMKMRSGGISVLPTYVFWNLHEPVEGHFCWDGNLDLRRFVELCRKHGMKVIVRIGPFAHGEMRNGGFPDWLLAKGVDVRSNDPAYLALVEKLYTQIAQQLNGLYHKDGGPVIGLQIENEHQHSAAPWAITYPGEGKDHTAASYDKGIIKIGVDVQESSIPAAQRGEEHMLTLKRMAERLGMVTPLYTVTGWGRAAVIGNEAIPVTAAYTYPFWSKPHPSNFCLFTDLHARPDYSPVRYTPTDFPSFCAEMGVGMQHTYERRPLVTAEAAEALMVRTLGSGSNGIGYYMYHGGSTPTTPDGRSMNDEPMGMNKVSYDYQAPLGEYGLEHPSYRRLRLLHLFLEDFGHKLAPMETVLPAYSSPQAGADAIKPGNRDSLRYAMRIKDDSGFLFFVNFQDHDNGRHDFADVQMRLRLKNETLDLPPFTLPKDVNCILPFNLDMDGTLLKWATAQLLMKIDDGGTPHYFFFAPPGIAPQYRFGSKTYAPTPGLQSTFTVKGKGKKVKITTLTHEQALNACRLDGHLLITKAMVVGHELQQLGDNSFEYIIYPSRQGFKAQTVSVDEVKPEYKWEQPTPLHVRVHFPYDDSHSQVASYFLRLDYVGDVAMAFLDNTLVGDNFWTGSPWNISLRRFRHSLNRGDMMFYLRALKKGLPFLVDVPADCIPDFSHGHVCTVRSVDIVPLYKAEIGK